jgi:PAS domain S-box-containing protein
VSESASSILLVEDEPAHAELVRRAFAATGGRTRLSVAGTLDEARAILHDPDAAVDLVIADWKLPDGEGLDLIRDSAALRERPVILMTSHGSERIAVEALKAGALDYVVKSEVTLIDMPHIADRALRQAEAQTERLRMAEALRRSEEKYRHLVEDLPDIVYVIDTRGVVTFVSPAIEREGHPASAVLGRPFVDLFLSDDVPLVLERLQEALRGASVGFECRLRPRAGVPRWVWSSTRPVFEDGAVAELRGVLRDVTDRKHAQQALASLYQNEQRITRRLQEVNLMKTNFMIVTAHEMRTPLTILRGYVETLREGYFGETTPRQAGALDTCQQSVDRMIESFDEILEMLRLERGVTLTLRSVAVPQLLRAVIEELTPFVVKRGQQLRLEEAGPVPPIQADPARLRTVFVNLVENAIKFTPDGGEIVVEVGPRPGGLQVAVRDNGIGIEPGEAANVFDAFYTRGDTRHHRSGRWEFEARGSGLGLAIVRGHLEAHGGSVRVESAGTGRGTTFTVVLPEQPPESFPEPQPVAAPATLVPRS